MAELTITEIIDEVAARFPMRDAIVSDGQRTTYGQLAERSNRLANFLIARDVGAHQERSGLDPWQSGQDHIGLYMFNGPEYLESEFGIAKARAAAININYRYVADELLYLANDANLVGLVFHSAFASEVNRLRRQRPQLKFLLQVPGDSAEPLVEGAIWYQEALQASSSDLPGLPQSPDDLHILYTGGTTGLPKGVLWRQADVIVAGLGGRRRDGRENELADFIRAAERSASRTMPTGPFMHASGRWTAMSQLLLGNVVVLPRNPRRFDPDDVLTTIEQEQVSGLNITGDAMARPLIEQLDRKRYDLSSLRAVTSGGALLSETSKQGLLRTLPNVQLVDTIGSSETGSQASAVVQQEDLPKSTAFAPSPGTTLLSRDLSAVLPHESSDVGWLARSGRVPLGYFGDPEKTRRTFPVVAGVRYAVPGDRARWSGSGEIELLGRDAVTINTGGEKVFAEEVELALKRHAAVADVVVCGRSSERWGQEVVAIVSLRAGHVASDALLIDECAKHLARYKLPKLIVYRDHIQRSPSGKPDYVWARAQLSDAKSDETVDVATI